MASGQLRALIGRLRTSTRARVEVSDASLLERFCRQHDDGAFAELVRRHGPMVFGVCRRLLANQHDAEDAFQASFLTLARKGGSIRQRDAVGSWLYKVAFRIALRARASADRRRAAEQRAEVTVVPDGTEEVAWRELRPVLDREVSQLPEKYRAPVVLCYLEGKSYEEAAGELGCPKGTIAIRLLRARHMLRDRLTRRGLTLAASAVATGTLLPGTATAAVPVSLAIVTIQGALLTLTGQSAVGVVSAGALELLHATARLMWVQKVKAVTAAVLGLALLGGGAGTVATRLATRTAEPVVVAEVPNDAPRPAICAAPVEVAATPPMEKHDPCGEPAPTIQEERTRAYRRNSCCVVIVIIRTAGHSVRGRGLCTRVGRVETDLPPADEPPLPIDPPPPAPQRPRFVILPFHLFHVSCDDFEALLEQLAPLDPLG